MNDLNLINKYKLPRRFIQVIPSELETEEPAVFSLLELLYTNYELTIVRKDTEETGKEAQQDVGEEFDVSALFNIVGEYSWENEGLDLEDVIMTYWEVFQIVNPDLKVLDFYSDYSLFYEQEGEKPPAENVVSFEDYYRRWKERINTEYLNEKERFEEALKEEPFDNRVIEKIPFAYRSAEYEAKINARDEIEVLNSITLDENVIFVKADSKYKAFKYLEPEDIEMIKEETSKDNQVVVIVKSDGKLFSIKGDFNSVSVRLPYDMVTKVSSIVGENMKDWNFKQTKFTVEMILVDQRIDDNAMVHCITNDKKVNKVFYTNEFTSPYASKNLLYFIHRLSSIESTIRTYKSNVTEVLSYGDKGVRIEKGQYYTLISVLDIKDDAQRFSVVGDIIKSLYYIEKKTDEINAIYDTMMPGVTTQRDLSGVREGRKKQETRLQRLKASRIGELFTSGYSVACQAPQQPVIIEENERQSWEEQEFEYKGYSYNRQVLEFPKENPMLFVCPDDTHPFPGLITFEGGKQSVCCYKTDQINNPNSEYNMYLRGEYRMTPAEKREAGLRTSTSYLTSGKMADVGRYGDLPIIVLDTLKIVINDNIYRFGVPITDISFIHCILLAINDKAYTSSVSDAVKNKVAMGYFNKMKTMRYIGSQEMTAFERMAMKGADPLAWYHVAEEMFKVNIVVSTPDGFSTGNYFNFPVLPPRPNRPTIIVYRHNQLKDEIPQVEVVRTLKSTTFGSEVAQHVYKSLIETNSLISIDINSRHTIRLNYYHRIDYRKIFDQASAQIIDGNGKTQAFLYKGITVFVPPTQPLGLPVMNLEEATLPDIQYVIEIVGTPVSYSIIENDVVGLFYSIADSKEGIFIPVKRVNVNSIVGVEIVKSKSTAPWLPQTKSSDIEIYDEMLISLENLWMLMTWVFYRSGLTAKEFMNRHCVVYDGVIPKFGDNVRIKTDLRSSFDVIMRSLSVEFNEAMRLEKFIIPDKVSFDKLTKRLERYMKTVEGLVLEPPVFISVSKAKLRYLLGGSKGDLCFLSDIEFKNWLYSKTNMDVKIVRKLEQKMSTNAEPIVYCHITGNLLIIQNVEGGNIDRAINVSLNWNQNKYNLGYTADEMLNDVKIPKIILGMNSNGSITVIENKDNVEFLDDSAIILLQYSDSRGYASVLPLN